MVQEVVEYYLLKGPVDGVDERFNTVGVEGILLCSSDLQPLGERGNATSCGCTSGIPGPVPVALILLSRLPLGSLLLPVSDDFLGSDVFSFWFL